MNVIFWYALASVFVVSFVSFIALATLSLRAERLKKILLYLVSFAAGALLGDVFFHLLPEVVEEQGFVLSVSVSVLVGVLFSFFVEKVVHWRHSHMPSEEKHVHPVTTMNLVGDGVHNFIDGIVIGSSYLVSIPVGLATTFAVFLHEIPQEIGDFGVLLHGGYTKRRALLMNFLFALTAVLGVFIPFLIGSYVENALLFLVPFAAGTFLYIAGSDLIPELHKEVGLKVALVQLACLILGMVVMSLLLLFE